MKQKYINTRTDLASNKNTKKNITKFNSEKIKILESTKNNHLFHTIIYKNIYNENLIKEFLKNELKLYLKKLKINKNKHIFIIGLGNESNTADSIGPKALKYIIVNSHLYNSFNEIKYPKISALEPGVLGTTGIDTFKIIKSVSNQINPDLIILIDSFVTNKLSFLNKSIEINDEGLTPGSGIHGNNIEIKKETIKVPVLVIGIPTALEFKKNNETPLLICTNNIDEYVNKISKIIGTTINEILYHL